MATLERQAKHFDTASIMDALNDIDNRNIRTIFKQAKDPVELAFEHINKQSLKKVTTDAIKESVNDVKDGIEDLKYSMGDLKSSFADFFSFVTRLFTTNEEFIPEKV